MQQAAQVTPPALTEIGRKIEDYKKMGAYFLIPITNIGEFPPYHTPVIDEVYLSPKPDDGDVYKQRDGYGDRPAGYALTAQALGKLSILAAVEWQNEYTHQTVENQNYSAFRAVGCIRKLDGQRYCLQAHKDLDMGVEEDEIRAAWEATRAKYIRENKTWFTKMNAGQQDAYIENKVASAVRQKRRYKKTMVETGARSRVLRPLLNIKRIYTLEELKRPFVAVSLKMSLPMDDPDVKKALIDVMIKSQYAFYGPPQRPQLAAPVNAYHDEPVIPDMPDDIPEAPADDEEPEHTPRPQASADVTGDPPLGDTAPTAAEVFAGHDDETQYNVLVEMMVRKAYDPETLKKPLEKFTQKNRQAFFEALNSMPDKPKDDIPF